MHETDLRRWRLVLGGGSANGTGLSLQTEDMEIDKLLNAIYGSGSLKTGQHGNSGGSKSGGSGDSNLTVSRWLGDIRSYFPSSVADILQQDAIDKIGLEKMLMEPGILEQVEANINLVATIISLQRLMPTETRHTARRVVNELVEALMKKWRAPMQQAVTGALNRAVRNPRPKHNEIDWNRTIRANLKHYQADYKTIVAEKLIGYGHKKSALKDIILCVDQSGSMGSSVVYSSIFGAVLASLPALKTHFIPFDTAVVDLTAELDDPVDLLFATQLGGGTFIGKALTYCQGKITRPQQTTLVLITDLFEGGPREVMYTRMQALIDSGVQVIILLALNDSGSPGYSHEDARLTANMGIPTFACTPDLFPDLMATALSGHDIQAWQGKYLSSD
ncbi:MAG: VWA domain-containing protein [Chloroflexota bacterium]